MTARIHERMKLDQGLKPQALNNTNATGKYFPMKLTDTLCALLNVGAMAATKTAKIELYEATDAAGTGAALISGKAATLTANSGVIEATLTLASVLADTTVTINGVVFTAHASTTTVADREFDISGSNTADAAALATCINDADYGVPGVTAVADTGVVTLTATAPGEKQITAAASEATVTIATVAALLRVALAAEEITDGCTHVAAKVTVTANTVVSVSFLRDGCRFSPYEMAGATA